MMKRRNYLICSIIAMLSIVSYACETEYAICEGCGTSEDFCKGDTQRCAESLNGRQVCSDGKWGSIGECMGCYNKNTDNSDAASLVCNGCTPNSYNELETEVCYKGDFKKFESKAISEGDTESSVILNSDSKNKGAPWELAFNKTVTKSGSFEYYNCHDADVFGEMKINGKAQKVGDEEGGCEGKDYYMKRTGYKYYSVEVCRKVEFKERIEAVFWAYKYTSELNDLLIGNKKNLPYSLCYDGNLLIANNINFSKEQHSVYKPFECPSNYGCNEKYDELCVIEKFEYNDEMEFKCKANGDGIPGGESITYNETSVAKCPAKTTLEIQNKDGSWSACKDLKFKLNQARCVPTGI